MISHIITGSWGEAMRQIGNAVPVRLAEIIGKAIYETIKYPSVQKQWDFASSLCSQYRQIGNAVPVNLGYHIGCCLIEMLTNKNLQLKTGN